MGVDVKSGGSEFFSAFPGMEGLLQDYRALGLKEKEIIRETARNAQRALREKDPHFDEFDRICGTAEDLKRIEDAFVPYIQPVKEQFDAERGQLIGRMAETAVACLRASPAEERDAAIQKLGRIAELPSDELSQFHLEIIRRLV